MDIWLDFTFILTFRPNFSLFHYFKIVNKIYNLGLSLLQYSLLFNEVTYVLYILVVYKLYYKISKINYIHE